MAPVCVGIAVVLYNLYISIYIWINSLCHRHACFLDYMEMINKTEGGVDKFTKAYDYYGIHILNDNSVTCREWAPGAKQVYLTGQFSKYFSTKILFFQE